MKTTFKKTIDTFEESYVADDSNIIEPLALDIDRITAKVMDGIHQTETPAQPKKKKRWIPLLIAAAIATTVISTTVIAVTGGLGSRFSDIVSGETDAVDLYDGGSFTFDTTDDNLQAQFLGVTGDENTVLAALALSYKDGSTFTGEADGFLEPTPEALYFEPEEHLYRHPNGNFVVIDGVEDATEMLELEKVTRKELSCGMKAVRQDGSDLLSFNQTAYLLSEDKKTLKIYFSLDVYEPGTAVDGTLTFASNFITLYQLTDKIAEYDTFDTETMQTAAALCQEQGITDATRWERRDGKYALYRFTTQKHDLPLTASFKMNYEVKDNALRLELTKDNAPHTITDDYHATIKLTPFCAKLQGDRIVLADHSAKSMGELQRALRDTMDQDAFTISEKNSKIILKDGTEYYFGFHVSNLEIEGNLDGTLSAFVDVSGNAYYTEQPVSYYDMLSSSEETYFSSLPYLKRILTDPQNIAQVIVNGDTVYTAPDA